MAKTIGPLPVVLAAATPNPNVLQGQIFEFLEDDGLVRLAVSVPLAAADDTTISFRVGSQVVVDTASVPTELAVGAGPDLERQVIAEHFGLAGDRLSLQATSVGGTTLKVVIGISD